MFLYVFVVLKCRIVVICDLLINFAHYIKLQKIKCKYFNSDVKIFKGAYFVLNKQLFSNYI